MKDQNQRDSKLRDERNAELLRRMRNGESMTSFSSASSWFPPRPVIEKDAKEVARLYGEKRDFNSNSEEHAAGLAEAAQVVSLAALRKKPAPKVS